MKYACTQSAISQIVNETASFINTCWGHLLRWESEGLLSPGRLQIYAHMLHNFGAPTQSIFRFINCTICQTCCPVRQQELAYTGYKKFHGMKFQGVVTPDGLFAHLNGPYRAPQNDSSVLNESELLAHIEKNTIQPWSNESDPPSHWFYQLYGDSAYGVVLQGGCQRPMTELLSPLAVMSGGLGFNLCVAPFLNVCVPNLPQGVRSRECWRWSELVGGVKLESDGEN